MLAVLAAALLLSTPASASIMRMEMPVCDGFTVSRRGDDLLLRCPGLVDPFFTWKDMYRYCARVAVTRQGAGNATIVTIACRQ